jgi:hypothetical protein
MQNQECKNTAELNIIASLVMEHCTTPETSASKAVERLLLELEQSKATIKLLEHELAEHGHKIEKCR